MQRKKANKCVHSDTTEFLIPDVFIVSLDTTQWILSDQLASGFGYEDHKHLVIKNVMSDLISVLNQYSLAPVVPEMCRVCCNVDLGDPLFKVSVLETRLDVF